MLKGLCETMMTDKNWHTPCIKLMMFFKIQNVDVCFDLWGIKALVSSGQL